MAPKSKSPALKTPNPFGTLLWPAKTFTDPLSGRCTMLKRRLCETTIRWKLECKGPLLVADGRYSKEAVEKGLIEKEKNNYSISQYVSHLAEGNNLDANDIDSLNKIVKFRNNIIHNSLNPSLEMYLEIIQKLELINPRLIGLIQDNKVEKRK